MPIEISQVISLLSLIIAAAALYRNAKGDTKASAGELTTVIVKLENIQEDIKEVKNELKDLRKEIDETKLRVVGVERNYDELERRMLKLEEEIQNVRH